MAGSPGRRFGSATRGDGVWQAMEQFVATFDRRAGTRVSRGDVRAAVITLLAEQPMHGYQIIREIGERSGGGWKPSAGSVYPALQLLADEGVVTVSESNGRKTYSLTDAGRDQVAPPASPPAWQAAAPEGGPRYRALPRAGVEVARAAAEVGRNGTPEQIREAVRVLDDARKHLYAILTRD